MDHWKEILSFECNVTGIAFYCGKRKLESLSRVSLVRDSDNPHDHNAVMVLVGGEQLGFIDRVVSRHLAPVMDRFKDTAKFIGYNNNYTNI